MIITEIFSSLQGEGKNQGKPCLFIRLAGCNLRCSWCDTRYAQAGGTEMPIETLMDQISFIKPRYVCITGGEPLLQADELESFLSCLHSNGIQAEIETNGTVDFSCLQQYASICMDVKCPSSGEQSDIRLLGILRPEDSVKFVIGTDKDMQYALDIVTSHALPGEIFFSPVYGTDPVVLARFIMENHLPVRFQVQLHKVIGVR